MSKRLLIQSISDEYFQGRVVINDYKGFKHPMEWVLVFQDGAIESVYGELADTISKAYTEKNI